MTRRDRTAAPIVEAAYRWFPDDDTWLEGITHAATKLDVAQLRGFANGGANGHAMAPQPTVISA